MWQPVAGIESEHPISTKILINRATYGAFLDELDRQIERAKNDISALETQGNGVLVEVHWNGISSYAGNTLVEMFYRDAENPETVLWVGDAEQGFTQLEVGDISAFMTSLPGEVPIYYLEPGRLVYLDDPRDDFARGMHIVDSEGRVMLFWDPSSSNFALWRKLDANRHILVNGLDKTLFGFSEEELGLLWETFVWIELGLEDASHMFAPEVSIMSTDLPEWAAGSANFGVIRINPSSFMSLQPNNATPRQVDVIWLASLLVHEMAHINQPGECSPEYAATQGMTFEEYGLWVETGPGQAYEQEVLFIESLLDLRNEADDLIIADTMVREILERHTTFIRGALGKAAFPDGQVVITCADEN